MANRFRIIGPDSDYKEKKVQLYKTDMLNDKANLTMVLLERWGPVLATVDGEDSLGRQKARPLTPKEIVEKACAIASEAFDEFGRRGWMIELPDVAEINADKKKVEA